MTEACLSDSTFKKADLSFCDLTDALVEDCKFELTDLLKAKLVGVSGSNASFIDIFFDQTNLSFANLSNVEFRFCKARQADFGNAVLDGAEFNDFDLDGVENLSASVRLSGEIWGRWINDNNQEYLELYPLYGDRIGGVLYSRSYKVAFTGILERGRYVLEGTEVAASNRMGYAGFLSVRDTKSLQVELSPDRSRTLPSFGGIFLPRD